MPTALENLDTKKVSLVRRGAQKKRFALFKGDDMDERTLSILKACLDTPLEDEASFLDEVEKAGLTSKAGKAMAGVMRILQANDDELSDEDKKRMFDQFRKVLNIKGPKKEGDHMDKKEARKDDDVQKSAPSAEVEAVLKAHQEAIAKAEKRAEEAEQRSAEMAKVLKEERDYRLLKEHVAKAEQDYSHLGASAKDLGEMFRDLNGFSPELGEKFAKLCKSASDLIEQGGLGPIGVHATKSEHKNAWELMVAKAHKIEADSNGKLSHFQALDRVMAEDTELYQQYLNENPAQGGM